MKRKDKREEAAYLNVIDVCGCGNCPRTGDCQLSFSLMCDKGKAYIRGFMAGSDWSDENQLSVIRDGKMNTNIWHDINEKPTRNCEQGYVVITFANCVIHLAFTKSIEQFLYRVCAWNVRCWAYADEILPLQYIPPIYPKDYPINQ